MLSMTTFNGTLDGSSLGPCSSNSNPASSTLASRLRAGAGVVPPVPSSLFESTSNTRYNLAHMTVPLQPRVYWAFPAAASCGRTQSRPRLRRSCWTPARGHQRVRAA